MTTDTEKLIQRLERAWSVMVLEDGNKQYNISRTEIEMILDALRTAPVSR